MGFEAAVGLALANFIAQLAPGQNVALVAGAAARGSLREGAAALIGVLVAEALWTVFAASLIAGALQVDLVQMTWLQVGCGIGLFLFGLPLLIESRKTLAQPLRNSAGRFGKALSAGVLVGLANPLALVFFLTIMPLFITRMDGKFFAAALAAIILSSAAALAPYLLFSAGRSPTSACQDRSPSRLRRHVDALRSRRCVEGSSLSHRDLYETRAKRGVPLKCSSGVWRSFNSHLDEHRPG